jgi:hypothetical protein
MFEQLIHPSIKYCLHLFSTKTLIKATAVCVYLQTQHNAKSLDSTESVLRVLFISDASKSIF